MNGDIRMNIQGVKWLGNWYDLGNRKSVPDGTLFIFDTKIYIANFNLFQIF